MPKINLLNDTPTSENKFAHEKVAKAITDLVSNEEGGKTIALTGYWGSGKSSIIEMIKSKLKEKVFIFDAWEHGGDPLRRAFLESIIHYFLDKSLILKEYWDDKLEELARRKETTTTTDSIEPTKLGICLFIATFLTPLGLVLLNLWANIEWWVLILSIILSTAPFAIFLYVGIKYFYEKDKKKRKKIISILVNQSDKTITSTTYKTNDPTSIEFQEIFFNLMEEVSNKSKDKFLIVIDNLDRVDSEDALKIWSTMRTFFNFSKSSREWIKNTWLLVPYDSNSLKKLWKNEDNNSNDTNDKYLVNSFTEKTFQITFETPLPVISDSAKYFDEQLLYAFSDLVTTDEKHKIYRIFETLRNSNLPATPREIKLFINNITPTFRQWGNEIPPHIQGLYVQLRKGRWHDDSKVLSDLRNYDSKFLDETLFEVVHKEYRQYLASLYFNVEKDKALQILLGKEIENALIKADLGYLDKNQNLPGFSMICEKIIVKNKWAKEEPNILATAIYSLSTLTLEEDSSLRDSWAILRKNLEEIEAWKTITENGAKGLCAIIKRENSKAFSESMIKKIADSVYLFINKIEGKEDETEIKNKSEIISILRSISMIILQLRQINQETVLDELNFDTSANVYSHLMFLLTELDSFEEIKKYFKSSSEIEELGEDISKKITAGVFNAINWIPAFKAIYQNYPEISISKIIKAIAERLKEQTLIESEVKVLIHILIILKGSNEEARAALENLTLQGIIPAHFSKYSEKNCLYCILNFAPDGNLTPVSTFVQLANKGIQNFNNIKASPSKFEQLLRDYINLLISFSESESVFLIDRKDLKELSEELISILTHNTNVLNLISSEIFIKNESKFYNALIKRLPQGSEKSEYYILLEKYITEGSLIDELKKTQFNKDLARLYLFSIRIEKNDEGFIEYLKNGLNNLSREDFEKETTKDHENSINLIIEMVKNNQPPKLKTPFMELLISKLEVVLEDKSIEELISTNWTHLINALDENHKKTLLEKIRYKLNILDRDFSKIFDLFGDELLKGEIFEGEIDNVVNEGFSKLLDRKNPSELKWLKNLIEKNESLFVKCHESNLSVLKEKIKNLVNESKQDDTLYGLFVNLAKLLQVEINEQSDKNSEQ